MTAEPRSGSTEDATADLGTADPATADLATPPFAAGTVPADGLLSLPGTLTTFGDPDAGACVDGVCIPPTPVPPPPPPPRG